MSEIVPESAAPETAETGEAPTEEWSGVDQESWEATQQALQETREALEYVAQYVQPQFAPPPQQGPEPVHLDPLDDNFQQQLDQYVDQKFAGYAEYVQAQQYREGDARAMDILADDIAKNGEFLYNNPDSSEGDSKATARLLANSLIGEMNQQYPNDPAAAAEAAITKAAAIVRAIERGAGASYHDQQINQLSGLSGARTGLPAGGVNGANQQFTVPQGGSWSTWRIATAAAASSAQLLLYLTEPMNA